MGIEDTMFRLVTDPLADLLIDGQISVSWTKQGFFLFIWLARSKMLKVQISTVHMMKLQYVSSIP
ncbi:hypothetical protein Hanom_Chr11g01009761 [Helianthus anomalus]